MKTETLCLLLLAVYLIFTSHAHAECVCYKESETNDHFELLEVRYSWLGQDSVSVDVSVWNIEDSVELFSQIYYGLQPETPVKPELEEGEEIRVDLLPEFMEDSVQYSFELGPDFSRLMIQVLSSKDTEYAMRSCGIYHVPSFSSEDIDRGSQFGKLGPAKRAKPPF